MSGAGPRPPTAAGRGGGRARLLLAVVLLLTLTGCTAADDPAPQPPAQPSVPLVSCAGLTSPPPQAPTAAAPAGPAAPDVTLPCFADGTPVALAGIRGPAVVNLWASWCTPCREELPAVQRLAERTTGRLHVVGVVTRDDRSRAESMIEDLGLSFPQLDDPGQRLLRVVAARGLPATVFLDRRGAVRHVSDIQALDDAGLADLVAEHLGLTVTP